jgi:hypothetical protein
MIGTITVVAATVAVGGLAVAAQEYGGDLVWPGLAGNFVASLSAFVLALAWDRHRQRGVSGTSLFLRYPGASLTTRPVSRISHGD